MDHISTIPIETTIIKVDNDDTTKDGHIPSSPAVPLLLNPVYARTKSTLFDELRNFRICLQWCALDHSTITSKLISYTLFLILTFLIPAITSLSVSSTSSSSISFNKFVQFPESILATLSFLTLASFFRRYGLRQLLFLDGALRDDTVFVRHRYSRELDRAFKNLTYILLPSFSVELAHKIIFFSTVSVGVPFSGSSAIDETPWKSIAFITTLMAWVYRTGVFLLVCILFRLTCELQILRFEGLYDMFKVGDDEESNGNSNSNFTRDREWDAHAIFEEHMRIKRQLLVTSHRYRIFIIGCLITITASQLGALLLIFQTKDHKNFCNSGDVVVCSAVQLSGFLMCLLGAARITHRAQRLVSAASRWNMITSYHALPAEEGTPQSPKAPAGTDTLNKCQTCEEAWSVVGCRQALVLYLQHNGGGITLFGFALDRGLLHTLFVFEMTLVLWILSKVVVLS